MECPVDLPSADSKKLIRSEPLIEKYEVALLMILGFAGCSILIGIGYNFLRRFVFHDNHKFDVVFDAGGRVSLSLTTVTATSQLLWPAVFLQTSTIASKVGVGGSLWYTLAIVVAILLYAVMCIKLKYRAPGAKTYAQIAYARYGKTAHILFCCVALFTNLFTIANLVLSGQTVVQVLSKDSNNCLLLAILFGSYCLIGGLGTTFYISYFNTALIFIISSVFILKTNFFPSPEIANITSFSALYEAVTCLKGPRGNTQESLMTFQSETGLVNGILLLFLALSVAFCDQAHWQSKIAAKPSEGVLGFIFAGFLWFAIPTSVCYTATLIYETMSFHHGANLLTSEEIDAGYITPYVLQALLGKEGCYIMLTMFTMSLMSTGSGEVMSATSLIVYDIYKTYIRPYRKGLGPTECSLCGKSKMLTEDKQVNCKCPPATECDQCLGDIKILQDGKTVPGHQYICDIHGKYRHYEDHLREVKNWCMVCVILGIIPFGLLILESGMNLNWACMAAPVVIAPFIGPIILTVSWERATELGIVTGSIIGLVCGVIGIIAYASTYENGLSDFYINTAQEYSILTGLCSGMFVSLVISIVVSLISSKRKTGNTTNSSTLASDEDYEWQKTMSIDNPLNPYIAVYKHQLEKIGITENHVTSHQMAIIFRKAKIHSAIWGGISLCLFIIVIPAVALSQNVLSEMEMQTWISVCQYWCLVATVLVVVLPPVQETWKIWRQLKANKPKPEAK